MSRIQTSPVAQHRIRLMLYLLMATGVASDARAQEGPEFLLRQPPAVHLPLPPSAAGTADSSWDPRFLAPGTDSVVYTLLVSGDTLIMGGAFERVSTLPAASIALYDGAAWHPLGDGLPGSVRTLAWWQGALIAGGTFTRDQGANANYIARWTGAVWEPLAAEVDGPVYALTEHQGDLYAGGAFETDGTDTLNCIGRFDGTAWHGLGSGVTEHDPAVYALFSAANSLFVGGHFLKADGDTVHNIAKWDGARWSDLAGGLTNYGVIDISDVRAFARYDGELLVVGGFYNAQGQGIGSIALWDGANWSGLGRGNGEEYAVAVSGSRAFVGGRFTTVGFNKLAYNVARWDGTVWQAMQNGLYNADYNWTGGVGTCIAFYRGQVLFGGHFVYADSSSTWNIAAWAGTDWTAVVPGQGLGFDATCFTPHAGSLICGGGFFSAGMVESQSIAAWNGASWNALGAGLDNVVWGLTEYHGDLIAGGYFAKSGTTTLNCIGRWDGTVWQPLGAGLNGPVRALYVWHDSLVAVGLFTQAGGQPANHVAVWDGAAWHPLGDGTNDWVACVGEWNGSLVVGGAFTQAGGAPAAGVALWNGAAWTPCGAGVANSDDRPAIVYAVESFRGELVAGGDFDRANGLQARRLAAWNGATWREVGGGIDGAFSLTAARVQDLLLDGPYLTVCGIFSTAGDSTMNYIARWDGETWHPLGWGLRMNDPSQGGAWAMGLYDGGLYVGGNMSESGYQPVAYIARWDEADLVTAVAPPAPGNGSIHTSALWIAPLAVAHAGRVEIHYTLPHPTTVRVTVLDVGGRMVQRLAEGRQAAGAHTVEWHLGAPGASPAAGVYLLHLQTATASQTRRVVVLP